MKVRLKEDAGQASNVRGWLRAGREYEVLAVEAASPRGSGSLYRIQSEDNETPALFEAELFVLSDAAIPSNWIVVQEPQTPIQLMPASWAEPGYWERFFDGDPQARTDYEAAVRKIVARSA